MRELPVCPQSIPKKYCDECREKKAKKCDDCGSDNEVEYRPRYESKCLCKNCRTFYAIVDSLACGW